MKWLKMLVFCFLLAANAAFAASYYVATDGNDSHAGTSLTTPFRTIQKAANVMVAGDTCYVRAGTYRETVTPARSGTVGKPITFMPYNGETVIISGANPVTGWSVHSGSIYKADMAWDLGDGFNQVFVNGAMVNEARWPNTGTDLLSPTMANGSATDTTITFSVSRPANYWVGGKAHGLFGHKWLSQGASITASTSGGILTVTSKSNPWFTGSGKGFITGIFGELDTPGEWFRTGGKLYLWAPGSVNPSGLTVEAKARKWCVDISGKTYIRVQDIDLFAGSIRIDASNCEIVGCNAKYVSHFTKPTWSGWDCGGNRAAGDNGVFINGDSNLISHCTFTFSAGSGVLIYGGNNTVTRSVISQMDYSATYSCPMSIRGTKGGNKILFNTMHDTARDVIQYGASGNEIMYNDLYNAGRMCYDLGIVYQWGCDGGGTVYAYNWIHDNLSSGDPGLYNDNYCRNFIEHHNVIWNCSDAGVRLNAPHDAMQVYNNTLFNCDDVGTHTYNLYPNSMPSWWTYGNVKNSVRKNNLFLGTNPSSQLMDPANRDFRLKPGAPAIDTGVVVPPYTDGYQGAAPDLGAYESGLSRWTAGHNGTPVAPATAPSVSITSPQSGATFQAGAAITITANATDSNGTVSKVAFYADGTKIGEDTSSPYSVVWSGAAVGSHVLTAVATDNDNETGSSGPVNISVLVETVVGNGTGLTGEYYDTMDFQTLKVTRLDATVNFDWGTGTPDSSLGADTFTVRWSGKVEPVHANGTMTYTFTVRTDDGARLWVNGQQLVNAWVNQAPTENSGSITLAAGQKYDIVMEYFDNTGGAVAQLSWAAAGVVGKQIVPKTQLYPSTAQNQAPVANAGADRTVVDADENGSESVTLNGSASSDADGTIASYVWKEGATQIATGVAPAVTLAVGTHTITLTVTDDDGATDTDTVAITVSDPSDPNTPPVAGYSRWFDASKITGVADGGAVTTWQDLSGNNAHAAVPSGNAAPQYVANAGTGTGLGALYFARNSGASNSAALRFASDGNIRTVFSVFKGSSFLLTAASTYHFHRPGDTNAADPLWDATYAHANIKNGQTYVNGTQVNGTTFAMPTSLHNGFNLVEVVTTGAVTADSFNKDRTYHAGNQYHAEVIVYDRVLTDAERQAVENYLNAKWFATTSNTPPVAFDDAVTTDQGVPVGITLNALDADGDPLAYSIVTGPTHGTLALGTVPDLLYTPDAGFSGTDSFTFKVNDSTVDSNVATVTIAVNHVNTPPMIESGPWVDTDPVTLPNTTAAHVLADDVDGDVLTYTWSKVSGTGTATFTPNGTTLSDDTVVSFSAAGSYVLQVSVSDGAASTTGTVSVTVTDGSAVTVVAAINCGGGAFTAADGTTYQADGMVSGGSTYATGSAIANTVDDALYQSERYGNCTYSIPVANGTYTVTLKMAEVYWTAAGARVFDVLIEGATVLDNFDIFVEAGGKNIALDRTFAVNVADGALTIQTVTVVNAAKLSAIRVEAAAPQPWTPAQLTTAAWYDAADAATITQSGGAVSQWADKSGNGLNLTASSGTPATGSVTINNRNALDFTGDIMTTASNPFGATVNDAFVIAVHKVDAIAQATLFSLTGSSDSTKRWQSHAPWSDGKIYFDAGGIASPNRISANYGVSAGAVVLASWYGSKTDNVQQIHKNGALLVGDASGHSVATTGNMVVGGLSGQCQDTALGEFIVINGTVSAADRQKLEGYLAHKWGLQANLPADHPYKNAAPTVAVHP